MIHVIAKQCCNSNFQEFWDWQLQQRRFMVDTETTVTDSYVDRRLILVQFGSGEDEWLLQWSYLSEIQKKLVGEILFDERTKVLHNAYFDCVVFRFAGVVMRNVICTMVCEMILNCGKLNNTTEELDEEEDIETQEFGFYSLAGVLDRRLCLRISKTEQTLFGDDILTPEKVRYAAEDVRHLFKVWQLQHLDLHINDLEYTMALDCGALPGLAEMTYAGMPLDQDKWRANIDLAYPVVQQSLAQLEQRCHAEPRLMAKLTEMGKYSTQDTLLLNPKSPKQLLGVLQLLFPDLTGTSKAFIRGYMKRNDIEDPEKRYVLQTYETGSTEELFAYLLKHHRQYLIDYDLLIPAGAITINWNSPPQVLELFQVLDKKLTSLNKQSMAKFAFPIGIDLKDYKDSTKLISTYGDKFIEQHVESDGRVRTTFNPIVSTGRLSSRKPNMQNIPSKESVGNRYRNCFVAEDGNVYVDSDYVSQELVVIAFMSKDPVWTGALRKGQDLHSVCAEVVYKDKWKQAAEPNCAYYHQDKKKCSCKKHKTLRNNVKTINFGLAYGMSKFKLSAELGITLREAEALIIEYFTRFPGIKRTLNYLGAFGVRKGYIQTISPFFRKRWFPYWRFARHHIEEHLSGVRYDSTLGSIERASKNMPIQGASADMTKTAIWLIFEHIHSHGIAHKVTLVMQVHDQLTARSRRDYAPEWARVQDQLMLDAAKFSINNGLLLAETNITDVWTK